MHLLVSHHNLFFEIPINKLQLQVGQTPGTLAGVIENEKGKTIRKLFRSIIIIDYILCFHGASSH
jgi:hypothetical protein